MSEYVEVEFVTEQCITCGTVYKIAKTQHDHLKKSKATFYCPNGHPQCYTKSTDEILREQLEQKNQTIVRQMDQLKEREKVINRLEKRIKRKK